jgi:hypothetical protein
LYIAIRKAAITLLPEIKWEKSPGIMNAFLEKKFTLCRLRENPPGIFIQ